MSRIPCPRKPQTGKPFGDVLRDADRPPTGGCDVPPSATEGGAERVSVSAYWGGVRSWAPYLGRCATLLGTFVPRSCRLPRPVAVVARGLSDTICVQCGLCNVRDLPFFPTVEGGLEWGCHARQGGGPLRSAPVLCQCARHAFLRHEDCHYACVFARILNPHD